MLHLSSLTIYIGALSKYLPPFLEKIINLFGDTPGLSHPARYLNIVWESDTKSGCRGPSAWQAACPVSKHSSRMSFAANGSQRVRIYHSFPHLFEQCGKPGNGKADEFYSVYWEKDNPAAQSRNIKLCRCPVSGAEPH